MDQFFVSDHGPGGPRYLCQWCEDCCIRMGYVVAVLA